MIGRYRILSELGRGAQGVVYLAQDTRDGRRVALKVLAHALESEPNARARMQREAGIISKLSHPGICKVVDTGKPAGVAYLAMEWIAGETLADKIRAARNSQDEVPSTSFVSFTSHASAGESPPAVRGAPDPPDEAPARAMGDLKAILHLIEKVARALHAAHETDLIHRDIKPGNIMVTPDGEPIILDFGLAHDEASTAQTLTAMGDLLGTPAYLSPEQLLAQHIKVDRRTDVYSLAVTLFECLTLRRPFEDKSREALYRKILAEPAPDVCEINPAVPAALSIVVGKALGKDREKRYRTALDFALELKRIRLDQNIRTRPPGVLARLARAARRHRALASAVGGASFLLAGAITYVALRPPAPAKLHLLSLEPAPGRVRPPVMVKGTASHRLRAAIVDGRVVEPNATTFQAQLELDDGPHAIEIRLTGEDGQESIDHRDLEVDGTPPDLARLTPADGESVPLSVTIRGIATEALARATINGKRARLLDAAPTNAGFEVEVDLPPDGTVTIELEDALGNVSPPITRHYRSDRTPPQIDIQGPAEGATIDATNVQVIGKSDKPLARASVKGVAATIGEDGLSFRATVDLGAGKNDIPILAEDRKGASQQLVHAIQRVPVPGLTFSPQSDRMTRTGDFVVTMTAGLPLADLFVDGQSATREAANKFNFRVSLHEGENVFTLKALGENRAELPHITYRAFLDDGAGPHLKFEPPSDDLVAEGVIEVHVASDRPLELLKVADQLVPVNGREARFPVLVLSDDVFQIKAVDKGGTERSYAYRLVLNGWQPWHDVRLDSRPNDGPDVLGSLARRRDELPPRKQVLDSQISASNRARRRKSEPSPTGLDDRRQWNDAVNESLAWLKRHRAPDGHWSSPGFSAFCRQQDTSCDGAGDPAFDIGVTALAVLCYFGAGYDLQSPEYGTVVRDGLRFLKDQQDRTTGCFGSKELKKHTYGHACATMAAVEAYASTRDPLWRRVAMQAVEYVKTCTETHSGAWGHGGSGDNDASATAWMMMALASAESAKIDNIDFRVAGDGQVFLRRMTNTETGQTGYYKQPSGHAIRTDVDDDDLFKRTANSESLSAAATWTRSFWSPQDELIARGVELLKTHRPVWDESRHTIDFCLWFWGTQALFQRGGADWSGWRMALSHVVEHQSSSGCSRGSWSPKEDPWGTQGGRVYATALMTLCLETPYRVPTRWQQRSR